MERAGASGPRGAGVRGAGALTTDRRQTLDAHRRSRPRVCGLLLRYEPSCVRRSNIRPPRSRPAPAAPQVSPAPIPARPKPAAFREEARRPGRLMETGDLELCRGATPAPRHPLRARTAPPPPPPGPGPPFPRVSGPGGRSARLSVGLGRAACGGTERRVPRTPRAGRTRVGATPRGPGLARARAGAGGGSPWVHAGP